MRRRFNFAAAVLSCALAVLPAHAETILKLWPDKAPGSEAWTQQEQVISGTPVGTVAINVVTPTLTAYLPAPGKATGTAVIIAPGGYCVALALSAEGTDVAEVLREQGIAAFVLKYRIPEKKQQGIPQNLNMDEACRYGIADAIRAVAVVREHAAQWGIMRIGILGFSAGGMVASGALLAPDPAARPDFAALLYGAPFGEMPAMPAKLPPIFMAWAEDDTVAGEQVRKFYDLLRRAGNDPEAHVFVSGGHGFGVKHQGTTSDHWEEEFYWWLQVKGLLKPLAGASGKGDGRS